MSRKAFLLVGATAISAAIFLSNNTARAGAEIQLASKSVDYLPTQALTHDIGSQSVRGYYGVRDGACAVFLMITEMNDPDSTLPLSAARLRLLLARLDDESFEAKKKLFKRNPFRAEKAVRVNGTVFSLLQRGRDNPNRLFRRRT
jgi:hypothetical protein